MITVRLFADSSVEGMVLPLLAELPVLPPIGSEIENEEGEVLAVTGITVPIGKEEAIVHVNALGWSKQDLRAYGFTVR